MVAEVGAARQRTPVAGDTGETRAPGNRDRSSTSNDPPRGARASHTTEAPMPPHESCHRDSGKGRATGDEGGRLHERQAADASTSSRRPHARQQHQQGWVTPSWRGRLQRGAPMARPRAPDLPPAGKFGQRLVEGTQETPDGISGTRGAGGEEVRARGASAAAKGGRRGKGNAGRSGEGQAGEGPELASPGQQAAARRGICGWWVAGGGLGA